MTTLTLNLYLEDDISETLSKCELKKPIIVNFGGQDWEVSIDNATMMTERCGEGFYEFRRSQRYYTIDGTISNKSEKLFREAKAEVRKKQQEFKEAQRKLSELMEK